MTTTTTTKTIDQLNSFLRDELAAVETYGEALLGRSAFSGKTELSICQRSHEARAASLSDKIASLGGEPAKSAGVAGAWKRLLESGAVAIGQATAIRELEREEDHVLQDYRTGLASVDPEARAFLESKVIPEEEYTHRTMSDLEHRLASA